MPHGVEIFISHTKDTRREKKELQFRYEGNIFTIPVELKIDAIDLTRIIPALNLIATFGLAYPGRHRFLY
ncbi:MAG: hypothetical protein R6V04_01585 [bacterium]